MNHLPDDYFFENGYDRPLERRMCNDLAEYARECALGRLTVGDAHYLSEKFENLFRRLMDLNREPTEPTPGVTTMADIVDDYEAMLEVRRNRYKRTH